MKWIGDERLRDFAQHLTVEMCYIIDIAGDVVGPRGRSR